MYVRSGCFIPRFVCFVYFQRTFNMLRSVCLHICSHFVTFLRLSVSHSCFSLSMYYLGSWRVCGSMLCMSPFSINWPLWQTVFACGLIFRYRTNRLRVFFRICTFPGIFPAFGAREMLTPFSSWYDLVRGRTPSHFTPSHKFKNSKQIHRSHPYYVEYCTGRSKSLKGPFG